MPRIPLVALLFMATPLAAAEMTAGDFDPRFGDPTLRLGLVEPPLTPSYSDALAYSPAVVVDAEGRQLLLTRAFAEDTGASTILVQRFANGVLDDSFADGGAIVITAEEGQSFVLSPGEGLESGIDSIWLAYSLLSTDDAGETQVSTAVRRFDRDGDPVTAFGNNGVLDMLQVASENAYYIALASTVIDGRLIVARQCVNDSGSLCIEVLRFHETGIDDAFTPFRFDGFHWPRALEADASGNMVLQIEDSLLQPSYLRITAAGGLDPGFHGEGVASFFELLGSIQGWREEGGEEYLFDARPYDMMVDDDGRLLIAGVACCWKNDVFGYYPFVARFNADGTSDGEYGQNGWYSDPTQRLVQTMRAAYSPDNGVVLHLQDVLGQHFAQRHYLDHDGRLDARFGTGGIQLNDPITAANDIIFSADGSVLIAGGWGEIGSDHLRAALARYLGQDEILSVEKQATSFAFADRTRVDRFEFVVTETKQLPQPIQPAVAQPFYITGGEMHINGRYRIGNRFGGSEQYAGYLPPGAAFSVTTRAAAPPGEAQRVLIEVGDFATEFDVVTEDDLLDSLVIPPVDGAEPGALTVSDEVVVSGIDVTAEVRRHPADGGEISADNGVTWHRELEVENGDRLRFRATASPVAGASVTARFQWGDVFEPNETYFFITTRFEDVEPEPDTEADDITFGPRDGIEISTFVASEPVVISGINALMPISVLNGCYFIFASLDDVPETHAQAECRMDASEAHNGQVIVVAHVSASTADTEVTTVVNYGTKTAGFTSTTASVEPEPEPQPRTSGGGPLSAWMLAALCVLCLQGRRR